MWIFIGISQSFSEIIICGRSHTHKWIVDRAFLTFLDSSCRKAQRCLHWSQFTAGPYLNSEFVHLFFGKCFASWTMAEVFSFIFFYCGNWTNTFFARKQYWTFDQNRTYTFLGECNLRHNFRYRFGHEYLTISARDLFYIFYCHSHSVPPWIK